jgi:acyl-CoA thioester hydrolase
MDKHTLTKKIYYHDTDAGGVVYYANYLKYFEEARHEFLASKGLDLKDLKEKGFLFVVKKMTVNYKKPARYGQEIEVDTCLFEKKRTSFYFHQSVRIKEAVLTESDTQIVCVNRDILPVSIPKDIKV